MFSQSHHYLIGLLSRSLPLPQCKVRSVKTCNFLNMLHLTILFYGYIHPSDLTFESKFLLLFFIRIRTLLGINLTIWKLKGQIVTIFSPKNSFKSGVLNACFLRIFSYRICNEMTCNDSMHYCGRAWYIVGIFWGGVDGIWLEKFKFRVLEVRNICTEEAWAGHDIVWVLCCNTAKN